MTDPKRLAEIEARVEKATKGPWEIVPFGVIKLISSHGVTIAQVKSSKDRFNDREFIAHARTDIPWLTAELRARDAEIKRLKESLEWHANDSLSEALRKSSAALNPEVKP